MSVQYKDYYQSLGVPRTATADELKKSFRKLAREFHPDVAKDKKKAEEKFKEINEAYEVLSDPDKRKKYDELGANWKSGAEFRPPPGQGGFGGDLYLRVRLAKHPDFEVDGHNLIYELELAPWEAALGAEISVPTLDGRVNIKIPAGTASGQKLRVRGRGLGKTGDLLVTTKIVVPQKISDAQKKLWESLAKESKFNPRD